MNPQQLLDALHYPTPETRRISACIIGVVEETSLLIALHEKYTQETDAPTQKIMLWAGKRLIAAEKRGYKTLDEIFRHFGIDRELEHRQTEEEIRLLEQMNAELENELIGKESKAKQKQLLLTAGVLLLQAQQSGGIVAIPGAPISGAEIASSNLGPVRQQISRERTPPLRPSNTDISVWVKRLQNDTDSQMRIASVRELALQNNIKALPILATQYLKESNATVKEEIERAAKILYWSAIYWQMSQDGSLEKEINERLTIMMAETSFVDSTSENGADAHEVINNNEDISEILRRVEAKRR
ncbi:MAG: hypothetical protein CUN55_06625, partial [Phototrophicales bacterium]